MVLLHRVSDELSEAPGVHDTVTLVFKIKAYVYSSLFCKRLNNKNKEERNTVEDFYLIGALTLFNTEVTAWLVTFWTREGRRG